MDKEQSQQPSSTQETESPQSNASTEPTSPPPQSSTSTQRRTSSIWGSWAPSTIPLPTTSLFTSALSQVTNITTTSLSITNASTLASNLTTSLRDATMTTVNTIAMNLNEFDRNYQNDIRPKYGNELDLDSGDVKILDGNVGEGKPEREEGMKVVEEKKDETSVRKQGGDFEIERLKFDDDGVLDVFSDITKSAVDTTGSIVRGIDKGFDVAAHAIESGFLTSMRALETTSSQLSDLTTTTLSNPTLSLNTLSAQFLSLFEEPSTTAITSTQSPNLSNSPMISASSFETLFEENTGKDHITKLSQLSEIARQQMQNAEKDKAIETELSEESLVKAAEEVEVSMFWGVNTTDEMVPLLNNLRIDSSPAISAIKTLIRLPPPPSATTASHVTSIIAGIAEQGCMVILNVAERTLEIVEKVSDKDTNITVDAREIAKGLKNVYAWWCAELKFVAERGKIPENSMDDVKSASTQIGNAIKYAGDVIQLLQHKLD